MATTTTATTANAQRGIPFTTFESTPVDRVSDLYASVTARSVR
jgi:hypothetical protein